MVFAYKITKKRINTAEDKIKYIDVKSNINVYVQEPELILNLTYQKNLLNYKGLMAEKENKINQFKNLKLNINLKIKSHIDFLRAEYSNDNFKNLNHIQKRTLKQYENNFKVLNGENSFFKFLKVEPKENHFKRLLWIYANYDKKFKSIVDLKSDILNLNKWIQDFNKYFFDLDLRLNPEKSESNILNFKDIEKLENGVLTLKAKEVLFFYFTQLKKTKGKQSKIFKSISAFEYENGLISDNDLKILFDQNLKGAYDTNIKNLTSRFTNLKNKVKHYI